VVAAAPAAGGEALVPLLEPLLSLARAAPDVRRCSARRRRIGAGRADGGCRAAAQVAVINAIAALCELEGDQRAHDDVRRAPPRVLLELVRARVSAAAASTPEMPPLSTWQWQSARQRGVHGACACAGRARCVPPRVSRAAEPAAAESTPQLPLSAHDDWRVGTAALDALLRLRRRSRASRTRRSAAAEAEGKAEAAAEEAEAAALAATRRAAASDDWYVRALRMARRSRARAHRAGMRRSRRASRRRSAWRGVGREAPISSAAPLSARSI
jgi:hypothetical protein